MNVPVHSPLLNSKPNINLCTVAVEIGSDADRPRRSQHLDGGDLLPGELRLFAGLESIELFLNGLCRLLRSRPTCQHVLTGLAQDIPHPVGQVDAIEIGE